MDSQKLWDLLRTVECEDVYQFVGEQSNAPLQVLQAAAESKYASIHNSSETGDVRRAGLELAGLCISDIFRDARSKQAYDEEYLGQSPPDRSSTPSGSFSRPVVIGAIAIVALCLVAVVVEIAPLLSSSDEGAAVSDVGADPESSSTVAAGDQEEATNDFESSDQGPVEVADASIPASPGTNRPPRTPEGELGKNGSAESQTLARSSAAATPPSSQPKRPSRARQPSEQPERRSSSRARSPSAPERKDESVQPGAGTLTIRAAPTSVIEVDGTEVGSTGSNGFLVLSEIQPGRHVVVARKEGYAEATSTVEVQEGRAEVVELASTALPGRLTVTANVSDVLVRVGDAGEQRLPLNGLELSAGSYRVTASRDGFRPVAKDLEIQPSALATLEFVLEPVPIDELLQGAVGLLASGDFRAAVAAARSVVGMRPESGAAHRLLGMALYEQRRFSDSIDPLKQAIDLGEEVQLSAKHRHGGGGFREGFCSGTITLSRNAITFESADQPDHGFSVGPDGLKDVEVTESYRRNAIRVNTTVQAADRGRRRSNFDFVHRNTERTKKDRDSFALVLTCRYCDASLNVQFELMNHVAR